MIASGKLTQSKSRFWQLCIIFLAVVVLPLGLACDKDNAVTDPAELTKEATMKTAAEQDKEDGIDWDTVMAIKPEEWSDELKAQIVAAGYDLEDVIKKQTMIAEGKYNEKYDMDAIIKEIEGAVEDGTITREEADEKYREISEKMSRKDKDDGVDWETAKTTAPEEWSDELKAQIEAAGYDLEQIAEKVSKYLQEEATRTERMIDLDVIKKELDDLVESGRITQEQADAKLEYLIQKIK